VIVNCNVCKIVIFYMEMFLKLIFINLNNFNILFSRCRCEICVKHIKDGHVGKLILF
jgi:hypothetical protein